MTAFLASCACSALILFIIRSIAPEYSTLGGVFAALVCGCAFIHAVGEVFSALNDFGSYGVGEYVTCMLEVTGICVCADICSDICSECGNGSLSKIVSLYAKAQVLLVVLPYVRRLVSAASSLFS